MMLIYLSVAIVLAVAFVCFTAGEIYDARSRR
jgi:hypothetical protein